MELDIPMLKAKLKYKGMTYKDAAKAIGVNRDTFSRRLRTRYFTVADIHRMITANILCMDDVMPIFFSEARG